MARVVQGGPALGQQAHKGRWQHPNATPPSKDGRWSQDTRWGHVAGGGPRVDTEALEEEARRQAAAPVPRKVRDDLLPRDKKKHWGKHAGSRDMRRRKRPVGREE